MEAIAAIDRLIAAGDSACAFADARDLDRVCRAVASIDEDLADQADEVAWWAERDMITAAHCWNQLAPLLRSRHGRAGEPESA